MAAPELTWTGASNEGEEPISQTRALALALRARWRLIAAFAVGGLVLMALITLMMERRYTATAVVHIENEAPRVTKIDQVVTGPTYLESVEYFQDQVSLLKSRTLMAAVIRELDLENDPRFRPAPPGLFARAYRGIIRLISRLGASPSGGGPPPMDDSVPTPTIDRYAANLEVKAIPNSRLIQVRATARAADLAQAIANAHANEYIARTLRAKFELTGAARKFIEKEVARVQQELDASERALDQFRRQNQIIAPEETQGNAVVERLADLSRRLTGAQAQRIELEAQHQLIEGRDFESLPAVLHSPLIQTLKSDLARLEAREAELARLFLEGNPELKQVKAQVRQTRGRLQKEIERAVAGVDSQYLAAKTTEDALREELGRQQESVLTLKQISGEYVKLDHAVQANRNLYSALLQRMGETDVVRGVQLSNIAVLDPAERPLMPSRPQPLVNLAFGLVLGLVFGVAAVALLESVDTSLRTPVDVERALALPTLGVIPDFRRLPRRDRLLAGPAADRSLASEVFRTLRTSVLFFDPSHPPRAMLVTSSRADEGKTATIVNLALSLAQMGSRVLLIDADLRRPRCHHALGESEAPGLAEYLRGAAELPTVTRSLELPALEDGNGHGMAPLAPRLDFVPSGRPVGQTAELLASERMRNVLSAAAKIYDIVLVDSPPLFPIADASLLSTMVDGVLLVVRGSRTPRHLPREALARLRFMQARVLGVVLNGVDPSAGEYAYRYSYYFRDAAQA
jgi:capsular exopolysaccharide synthesis family protein